MNKKSSRQYHLILNPAAGRGVARKMAPQVTQLVREAFPECQFFYTEKPGDARDYAHQVSMNEDVVIVAGGDGTIHEVVNGLIGGNATLGIIPIGSGNDFVRILNIPPNPSRAVEIIKSNRHLKMDVGKANHVFFHNGLGIGFDAFVVVESQKVKFLRGFLMYLFSIFKTLRHYHNMRVTIERDGVREERDIFMITVGNGKSLGGGFFLTPRAKINDHLLDVCIFRALSLREVLNHIPKALKGNHLHLPQVEYFQTSRIIISSDNGLPMHADGELLPMDIQRIQVDLIPEALDVIHNIPAEEL
ncbi:MAG: diacylglycerol kinase family lipid kinase [Calditrichaeota bacterium]|nr:MAG: diacylglycerol kinase family lipid kinase [Calditrichota bacterium]